METQTKEDALYNEFCRDARYHSTPHEFYSIRVGAKMLHDKGTEVLYELFKKAKRKKLSK